MIDVEIFVNTLEKIAADDSHGYDQAHRTGPNYDCSSLISKGLVAAGARIGYQTTRSLPRILKNLGFEEVAGTPVRGDIYVTPGHHCVTAVDESHIVHARSNEYGKITGGKSGDQTGNEICITKFYVPSYGWNYHFRYKGGVGSTTKQKKVQVGDVVTLACVMNVRQGPGVGYKKKAKAELTADGQKHANASGSLKKGTRCTIKEIKETDTEIWIKIPSGWVCAYQKGEWYLAV